VIQEGDKFFRWQAGIMKRMLILSMAFHALVAVTILVAPLPFQRALFVPSVYQVDLVTLPRPKEVVPTPILPAATTPIKKVEEEPVPPPKPEPKVKKAEEKPKVAKGLAEPMPSLQAPASEKIVPSKPITPQREEKTQPDVAAPTVPSITAGVELPDFKFPFYLKLLQGKISSVWSPPAIDISHQSKEVIISFVLFQTGRIEDIQVEQSSGNSFFDQAALRAVYMASPLPPLPRGFREPNLKVHFSFVLSRKG
jgi:TonB family protein